MVNCFAEETRATEVAGRVACSLNAEALKKKTAKKVSVDSSEYCFILIVDFLAARKLNKQSALSDQNRNSMAQEKASSNPDVLPKFRLGTSEGTIQPYENAVQGLPSESMVA